MQTRRDIVSGTAPLHSWDVFMYGYQRRMELSGDLKMLQAIQQQYKWHAAPIIPSCALVWLDKVVVITTPALDVIYVSENIFRMAGYRPAETIGRGLFMLQGDSVTPEAHKLIRDAVNASQPFDTIVTSHKKNGAAYQCRITGYPIFNETGALVNYLALENRVPSSIVNHQS